MASLLDWLLGPPRRGGSESLSRLGPSYPLSESGVLFADGQVSSSGMPVSETEALSLSGVFAACNLLSSVEAALPLKVYRKDGQKRVEMADSPAARILGVEANPEQSAYMHRRTRAFHRLLWGNGYSEIGWAGNGQPVASWTVEPWRVRPKRDDAGSLYYDIDNGARKVMPEDMRHTTLVSMDGVCGRSFVDFAFESLGLGLAAQQFAASFFGNGGRPGVILKHPAKQNDESVKKFRKQWNERHQGPGKAGGTAVLHGGWEYSTDDSAPPEEMQLLEQRRFSVEEVARWLNLPPHLLRDLARATFSNIEQQSIDFVTYTLGPVLVQEEQEINRKMLGVKSGTYAKHVLAGLLRGDSAARSAFYREMFAVAALSPNDILDLEDMDPVEGGDARFVPANMMTLESATSPPEPAPAPVPGNAPPADGQGQGMPPGVVQGMRSVLAATLERMARVEANAVRRLAEKPGQFLDGVEAFLAKHELTLGEAVAPVVTAAEKMGLPARAGLAAAWRLDSKAALVELSGRARASTLAGMVDEWAAGVAARAEAVARDWIGGTAS